MSAAAALSAETSADHRANIVQAELPSEKNPRTKLYPPLEPYKTADLEVDEVHTIHYELSGNAQGKPVFVVHGGPGGGICAYYRSFFDPTAYNIVTYDQRGCGQSTPAACLKNNTTWSLVDDVEKLRKELGFDKIMLFGGSWGSCLSMAYAQKYPERVTELVLRGIFTLRRSELQWFYQVGDQKGNSTNNANIFPDAAEDFLAPIPLAERGDVISAYHRRLTGEDEAEKLRCARAWSVYEMATSRLFVDPDYIKRASEDDAFALAFARIECHFFVNGGWFENDNQLVEGGAILEARGIPAVIVQGRYDCVCPARTAFELHAKWPSSRLVIVPDAGHSAKEEGIVSELVRATDSFRP